MFHHHYQDVIGSLKSKKIRNAKLPSNELPWFKNPLYCIGKLTKRMRKIRIINMLTKDEHIFKVCSEDKISVIQERFMSINEHAKGICDFLFRLCVEAIGYIS
jgi:hypothetical protein